MSVPLFCSRIAAAAARNTVNVPFRWVAMTGSQSSSAMLKSMRSRRMPATHTTPSMRPKESIADFTMLAPPSIVATELALATALPPAFTISSTTPLATSLVGSLPSIDTP